MTHTSDAEVHDLLFLPGLHEEATGGSEAGMTEQEKRDWVIEGLEQYQDAGWTGINDYYRPFIIDALDMLKAQKPITGETSDGYHTFNELYHHRAVLFSVIVANYKDRAWKSVRHHDGTMHEGMFIVGIDTPDGQATYHYDIDPYWDMFDCKVREFAPEWDGHTPAQAIERIGKLKAHEPHIVTIADYKDNPNVDKDGNLAVWRESRRFNGVACQEDGWIVLNRDRVEGWFNSEVIRFWTSRPSDEQREATAWDC